MQRQIRVVATMQIVEGLLEGVWGLVFAISPADAPGRGGEGSAIALLFVGLLVAAGGALRVLAGALNLAYLGRWLGIVALVVGCLSMATCCCMPTSLGLLVYGLLVYTNSDVRRAFAQRGPDRAAEMAIPPE
jgi:hypothetical protein